MSELHKFLFDGLPVRGALVRLTDAWTDILARRQSNTTTGAWPPPVSELLGEMAAAGVLMQSNIKFNGALVLQIFGDGPLKVAVVEVQHDLALRATAKVVGDHREKIDKLSDVLQHYMLQSEQLDTTLVLAADAKVAAGLLIQRLPLEGEGNLAGALVSKANEDEIGLNEHYNRIAILASTLQRQELLELDADTILRRLFWEEKLLRFPPQEPRFACTCSRERVANMIRGLGQPEADSIVAEQGQIEVGCDFCGQQYRFDAVDAAQLFTSPGDQPPVTSAVQ